MPGTLRPPRHRRARLRPGRRTAALLICVSASLTALLGASGPAHAEDIYRYWAYFHVEDDEYVASAKGVGEYRPADGAVEAFRYAAPADFTNPNLPRADLGQLTFEEICAADPAVEGRKRIAVIVDYGVPEDAEGADVPAPAAACAVVPGKATALQALDAVAETRTEDGLLCAVEGYPAQGCAGLADAGTPADSGPVEFVIAGQAAAEGSGSGDGGEPSTPATDEDPEDSTLLRLIGIGGVVAVLGVGGVWLSRRNRAT